MARRNLIILAVVLTALAFLAAEADFLSEDTPLRHQTYRSVGLSSFRVGYQGDIELDREGTGILRMSPDAALEVRERRFTSRRRLEVRPDARGNPVYRYEVGARELPREDAEEYLASIMDELVRTTTVGAQARARRILEDEGLEELLRDVADLESNAARGLYIGVAARMDGLDGERARRILATAGREMTSSSRLRATLTELAEGWPVEWDIDAALADAAASIDSSSEKGQALVELGRLRGLERAAGSWADATATIASSSEKGRTVLRLHELEPTARVTGALLDVVDTIDGSSERRRVLVELAGRPGLPVAAYSRAIALASGIESSSERASALAAMAPHLSSAAAGVEAGLETGSEASGAGSATGPAGGSAPAEEPASGQDPRAPAPEAAREPEPAGPPPAGLAPGEPATGEPATDEPAPAAGFEPAPEAARLALLREYVEAAAAIPSSPEAERALKALSASNELDDALCRLWIDSTSRVSSAAVATDLLVEAVAVCPGSGAVWRVYLAAVERLPSSSDQRRSLMALLERDDLGDETLRALETTAGQAIASTSERDAVLRRVEQVRSSDGS
jgi:hypothetical protein